MSDIHIKYGDLTRAIGQSKKMRESIDTYIESINSYINNPAGSLPGSDDEGNMSTATTLAKDKIVDLTTTKIRLVNFETDIQNVIDVAKEVDNKVSTQISNLAEKALENQNWLQKAGNALYNFFCVDIPNAIPAIRTIVDGFKAVIDWISDGIDIIHDWFKYGDGKYIWNIAKAVIGVVVAIVGVVVAVCAIPFTGGASLATIPFWIGAIGAAATAFGAIITTIDAFYAVKSNGKALSLSGNIFNADDADPGAARFYGDTSKKSEYINKHDVGTAEENSQAQKDADDMDLWHRRADRVAFICNILSLGNAKETVDGVTSCTGKWSFKENAWTNLKREFGFTSIEKSEGGGVKFDLKAFKFNLTSSDTLEKTYMNKGTVGEKILSLYTKGETNGSKVETLKNIVTINNNVKTTNNVIKFLGNADGIRDYGRIESGSISFSDNIDLVKDAAGVGKNVKITSGIDKYGVKGITHMKEFGIDIGKDFVAIFKKVG